ncbi:hypothetical protein N2152v2_000706 [Parachlorella kessleri]
MAAQGSGRTLTLLHQAVFGEKEERVAAILATGTGVINHPNRQGQTPLHLAADRGLVSIVKLLLDHGAAVDLQDDDGSTPVHLAAQGSQREVVELLVKAGCRVDIKNNCQRTPVETAVLAGRTEYLAWLLGAAADDGVRHKLACDALHTLSYLPRRLVFTECELQQLRGQLGDVKIDNAEKEQERKTWKTMALTALVSGAVIAVAAIWRHGHRPAHKAKWLSRDRPAAQQQRKRNLAAVGLYIQRPQLN